MIIHEKMQFGYRNGKGAMCVVRKSNEAKGFERG
jgi:hypothetical protein